MFVQWVRAAGLACLLHTMLPASLSAQSQNATIQIDAATVENSISRTLYGQFVEDFFNGVQGPLWDEHIRNRGFEEAPDSIGLSRDWEREPDNRNHDPALTIKWDSNNFYPPQAPGGHSLFLEISSDQWDVSQIRGVSQGRLPIQANSAYRGYLWVRASAFDGYVSAVLGQDQVGGRTYASQDIPIKNSEWTKYEFRLSPKESDPLAKFSILFHGKGRIWVDQVSLMPEDAVAGSRPMVYQKIQKLQPAFIRWPGGNIAQNYHWMPGVGMRDQRPIWIDHAWWNQAQVYDFGTDEFLELCRRLGTAPSITVNVEGDGATVEEAAAWVEYVNGSSTTKYGKMRAANGHPEPYHVKYWEIGNELFGKWEIGTTDATTYAKNLNRYVAAMKAVDPGIQVIACGAEDQAWNRELLSLAGQNIDYLAIHHYFGNGGKPLDAAAFLAHPLSYGPFYAELRRMIHELSPNKKIQLSINEWNSSLPMPAQQSMLTAVYAARMMNGFERNGDLIAMSAISDMVNGWSGGVIQSSRDGQLYVTPAYLVNELYSNHLGTQRLSTTIEGAASDPSGSGSSSLDAVVSRSDDGKEIFIKAANPSLVNPVTVTVHLRGAHVSPGGEIESIVAKSPQTVNSFSDPDAVAIRTMKIKTANTFQVELGKCSVSVITLHLR
jgi:alpha-N-arabinofuranosidase